MKKKVTWGEAWVILRPGTTLDDITAQVIHADVMKQYGPENKGLWRQFGQICSVVESSEGFPFKPEDMAEASTQARLAAYVAFLKLPSSVTDKLLIAYNTVNANGDVTIEDVAEDSDQKKA